MADAAAHGCLDDAGVAPSDIELLINTGIYHDRNLGEPALAALIQEDVGINAEDPHPGAHGTFSFDVANGTCGPLTALRILDGFLRAGTIRRGMVVSSDVDPGHHLARDFPFAPAGGAMVCGWSSDDRGLATFRWGSWPDDAESFRAVVEQERGRNLLQFEIAAAFAKQAGVAAAEVFDGVLTDAGMTRADVDVVVAAPGEEAFIESFAAHADLPSQRVVAAAGRGLHTVAFIAALDAARQAGRLEPGTTALFVAVGAGINAGACLYRP